MAKRIAILLLLLLLPSISEATQWAAVSDYSASSTIHTYGGGELFEKVLNSLAMIIYGNAASGIGKAFSGFLRIALVVGGFSCICLAFFREKIEPLIRNFFLPAIGITSFLLIPRTTVYIQDHLAQKSFSTIEQGIRKVENVPFFLGKVASLVSSLSYHFTRSLEGIAHGVNDDTYNWTGHIYANNNLLKAGKCRIANRQLEDNFREFCRECVFRDIGIGLYTKDALCQSKDILHFLEENTSAIRTTLYKTQESLLFDSNSQQDGFLPCKEAIRRMKGSLAGKNDAIQGLVNEELASDLGFLFGQKKKGEMEIHSLVRQQAMIDLLKEELPGTLNSFAAKRADLQQRENQKILGALGASSIVAMRNFFEATIYMVFPLMILVSLLSFGIKPLISWLQFVLWVNLWPPFFVVVNFLLNSIWNTRREHLFGDSVDLTVFTSEGLNDLYASMESIAAIAMAFIPFLSWAILKGGVSQMVHLASSLTGPAQSAASTAAAEKTTGNYSFGNLSYDMTNAHNAQMLRQTYSGQISTGSTGIDRGGETLTMVPHDNKLFLRQNDSYLREGISRTETFSSSLQDSLSSSESALMESSASASLAITDTSNKAVGLVEAVSKHMQTGENLNVQELTGAQESIQYIKNIADEYATANGISKDRSFREVFSASFGIGGGLFGLKASADASGSYQEGVARTESYNKLEKAAQSNAFQNHLLTIKNLSQNEVASLLGSEDAKLHQDFVESLNRSQSSTDNLRAAYTKQEALSNLKNYSESENLSIHQNLNQRFVDFLGDKYTADAGKISEIANFGHAHPEKRELIQEFASTYLPEKFSTGSLEDLSTIHQQDLLQKGDQLEEHFDSAKDSLIASGSKTLGRSFGATEQDIKHLKRELQEAQGELNLERSLEKEKIYHGDAKTEGYKQRRREVRKANKRILGGQALSHFMLFQGPKLSWNWGQKKGKELFNTWFKEPEE